MAVLLPLAFLPLVAHFAVALSGILIPHWRLWMLERTAGVPALSTVPARLISTLIASVLIVLLLLLLLLLLLPRLPLLLVRMLEGARFYVPALLAESAISYHFFLTLLVLLVLLIGVLV